MGLVDLSLVSQEPAYWGWLRSLVLEDVEAAIRLSNPDIPMPAQPPTETAQDILERVAGALAFTDTPELLERATELVANCQNSIPPLEPLLRFREQLLGFGGQLSKETAQAVGLALQEEILAVGASLDALAASPEGFAETLARLATGLEERQKTMLFLELTRSAGLIGQSSSRLRQLTQSRSLTRKDLLEAIDPLAELEGALADSLFYGEQSISSGISPSFAREILAAISVPLEEEIAVLRHLLLETSSQETKDHLKPGLEKMAGVFRILGQDVAADHMSRLARSVDHKLATNDIANALAQAEILVFGLLTHYPDRPEWEAAPLVQEDAEEEPIQPTNPNWEQAGLLVERWVKRTHPEDAIQAMRLLRGLDGLPSQAQPISAGIQKILEGCFTSLRTPGVPEKVIVLKGFRLLHALRFSGGVSEDQIAAIRGQLEQVATSAAKKASPPSVPKQPIVAPESAPIPAIIDEPAMSPLAPPLHPFAWESELGEEARTAFWHFSASHLNQLKKPEAPLFWVAMGWMEASVSMLAGKDHPLRQAITDACTQRQLTPDALGFLEWLQEGVQSFQKTQLEKALHLMEVYTAEARQAFGAGKTSHATSLLLAQAQLLSEHGFCAGDP